MPADATLKVDGTATRSTTGTRSFVSPVLEPGYDYTYEFSAEVVRQGRRVVINKTVRVQAGKDIRLTLDEAAPEAVAAR